ncbi:hypothetical protein RN001_002051 [Aquatica leii]|uniref:Uncharacterized protein n=1 Tax=Aquatica leii TaxID=1421715 RepID=A0AAN7SSR8_9COLE|nr:hypothetical protein RN001_002051 [Aquatica leii]
MACPYQQYYINQAGSGIGVIYRGAPYQRGHGIGSWLGGIFRSILPLFKSGVKAVGKEALRTGSNILGDIVENRPIKESFQDRMREAGQSLKRKADTKIENLMQGSGYKKPRQKTTRSTYKVKILEASLLVRRMRINPTILIAHTKALESTSAKYPITKADVKVLTIPSGIQRKSLDNVFLGQLPKRCIIGFVSNKAFNGDYATNPFNFHHYKINYLSLYIDGQQIPSKPLQPDFTKSGLYVRAYHTLYSGTGIHFLNEGNDISREDYPKGYCLMAFDLTPDLSANANTHWNLVKNGSLRIEVGFEDALSETINCLVYAEFDNVIEIDKHRNVMVDFSS